MDFRVWALREGSLLHFVLDSGGGLVERAAGVLEFHGREFGR